MEEIHDHEVCLGLGLGTGFTPKRDNPRKINKRVFFLDLSIPLHQSGCEGIEPSSRLKIARKDERQGSAVEQSQEDEDSNCSNGCSRKKLRLTRDQTTLLEESFRLHNTLNTAQKLALAEKLNLKPRQVEVWFQNRRARTKLKQTEVDCEFLKKNCERLTEENQRLKNELSELRQSLKIESPQPPAPVAFFQYHKTPVAGEKNGTSRGGGERKEAAAAAVLEGGP